MADPYVPYHADWKDYPDTTTPVTQAFLEYLEAGVAEAISRHIVNAKGDLIVSTADNVVARKAVGLDDAVLTAASAQGDGLVWQKIVNAMIDSAAAIAVTKLAGGSDDQFLRMNGSTVQWETVSVGGTPTDGWVEAGETWTFASTDDPTFTFTISGDQTGKYQAGMRVKLTQTTVKYFIITKVAHAAGTTTVTVYGGTDYDLINAAITLPYYSTVKAPHGFPLDPTKWTITFISRTTDDTMNPTAGTWANPASNAVNGDIHIGAWDVEYVVVGDFSPTGTDQLEVTLSTANNTESDQNWTSASYAGGRWIQTFTRRGKIVLTSKTTHYLNARTVGLNNNFIDFRGDFVRTLATAVCAYL